MKRICKICGTEFNVWPAYVKRGGGIYCSAKCQGVAKSEEMKNLPTEKKPSWKGGLITKKCTNCGKEIQVKQCFKDKDKFCSRSCASSYNVRNRPKERVGRICKTCGKAFEIHPNKLNRVDKNQGTFCSQRCRGLLAVQNQKKQDTDIEILLEKWLIDNNLKYEKQKPVEGISLVDFFIEPNICLYADGDYWHSLPDVKKRDKWQTKKLIECGYTVVRVLGSSLFKGEYPNELLQSC